MDEKDLTILYRPKVEIERDYRSDGVIKHELPENIPEEKKTPEIPEIPEDLPKAIQSAYRAGEKLLRIRKITEVLPTEAKPTVDDFLDTVIIWTGVTVDRIREVIENEPPSDVRHEVPGVPVTYEPNASTEIEEEEKEEEVITEADTETVDEEDVTGEWPTMTSSGFVFDVIKNKDSWDLAYEQYLQDSAAIQEEFAEEYNNVMEGYVYQLISAMDEVGIDAPEYLNYEYEGETVTGVPQNYQHLNDIIVRNQDIVSEYSDIFRKTHDLYTTDAILATYDIASQERVRYLKENYKAATAASYIDMYDKNYLAKTRDEFERKYIVARTNVYKLLHSAAQISKEMLAAQLELAISKCSLLSKEINIFAKREYEEEAYGNSALGTVKDISSDTSSSGKATDTVKQETDKKEDTSSKDEAKNNAKDVQDKTKEAANGSIKKDKTTTVAENTKKQNEKKGQGT